MIEAHRADIVVLHKKEKKCLIADFFVHGDCRSNEKEKEKLDMYQDLRRKVSRLWQQKKGRGTDCNWSLWKYKQKRHKLFLPIRK